MVSKKSKKPTEGDQKVKNNTWVFTVVCCLFVVLIFLNFPLICQTHGHDHHHHHDHHGHDHHHHHDQPPSFKYSKQANEHLEPPKPVFDRVKPDDILLRAMGSTLLVSIAPFLLLFLIPLSNSKEQESLLKVVLSFASGGLMGDAFLHLIPHALIKAEELNSQHGHGHSHGHGHGHEGHNHSHNLSIGLCILGGIMTFFLVEKAIRLVKGDHSHSHGHSHHTEKKSSKKTDKGNLKKNKSDDEADGDSSSENQALAPVEDLKIGGYLNLAADFLHNFTDGLAIGSGYLTGSASGMTTTIMILCHEVPHEIGDYAMLIQSGCSKKKAIFLQLLTAVGAMVGTYVTLKAGEMGDAASLYITPFTAGGFIYIATVSVIPELLVKTSLWQSIKEVIALLVGIGMMVVIAQYE